MAKITCRPMLIISMRQEMMVWTISGAICWITGMIRGMVLCKPCIKLVIRVAAVDTSWGAMALIWPIISCKKENTVWITWGPPDCTVCSRPWMMVVAACIMPVRPLVWKAVVRSPIYPMAVGSRVVLMESVSGWNTEPIKEVTLSLRVENRPVMVWLAACIPLKNWPPAEVAETKACSTSWTEMPPLLMRSRSCSMDSPVFLAISFKGLKPALMNCIRSWPVSLPALDTWPNTVARDCSFSELPSEISPSCCRMVVAFWAGTWKLSSVWVALARSAMPKGVAAAIFLSSSTFLTAASVEPSRVAKLVV